MNWKPWVLGLVALVVFDTVLVLGVEAYWRHQQAAVESSIDPVSASSVVTPAALPLNLSCFNGAMLVYRDGMLKPLRDAQGRPLPCKS